MPQPEPAIPFWQLQVFWTAVAATGTLLAVLVALRHDFLALFLRPKLRIEFKPLGPPDCDRNASGTKVNYKGQFIVVPDGSYNLRIRVHNHGRRSAKNAQIELTAVERVKESDGKLESKSFLPINLIWCHFAMSGIFPLYHPFIAGRTGAHFDLGVLFKDPSTGKPAVLIAAIAHAPTWSTLLAPGTYRLTFQLTAEGQAPTKELATFRVPEVWYPTEQETFEKGPGFSKFGG